MPASDSHSRLRDERTRLSKHERTDVIVLLQEVCLFSDDRDVHAIVVEEWAEIVVICPIQYPPRKQRWSIIYVQSHDLLPDIQLHSKFLRRSNSSFQSLADSRDRTGRRVALTHLKWGRKIEKWLEHKSRPSDPSSSFPTALHLQDSIAH